MTLLVSLFEKPTNLLLVVFLLGKIINLTKNSHKFQTGVTQRCTYLSKSSKEFTQNPSKVPVKMLNLK